ncbi:MAG TPA: nickel pincer cofactor biosynthesis protein LarC, partial [Chloroflexota bacterium]|nr:nickel pincer cofactor biosynthesis protein LarC [Chloroflexota bacterium]
GWQLEVQPVKKGALRATQVRISVTEPQPERDVGDIEPLIAESDLPAEVKTRAIALFRELADVEGIQHDQPPDTVHFHEVGAVDSILDIVGACAGLHALGVERIYVSPLNVGGGIVPTRDGILPVPGPAALELLRRKRAPIYASEYGPEFLTPTGALVLATLADGFGPFPRMRVERIGYGAGQKNFRIPNVLRVSIGEADARGHAEHSHAHEHSHDHEHDEVVELQTNIDDMNPEHFGHVTERLASAGALDVTLSPVYMKKGRPGTVISVLAHEERAEGLIDTLFRETTTLGVRFSRLERRTLPRETRTVETAFGPIRVKLALLDGAIRSAAPEYEDCHAAALKHGAPIARVYAAATSAVAAGSAPAG